MTGVVCSLLLLGMLCWLCLLASPRSLHASPCRPVCHSLYRSSVCVLDLTSNMAHQLTLPVEVKQLLVASPQQWIVQDRSGYEACPVSAGCKY